MEEDIKPISSSSVKKTNELKNTKNILERIFKTAQFLCFSQCIFVHIFAIDFGLF